MCATHHNLWCLALQHEILGLQLLLQHLDVALHTVNLLLALGQLLVQLQQLVHLVGQ